MFFLTARNSCSLFFAMLPNDSKRPSDLQIAKETFSLSQIFPLFFRSVMYKVKNLLLDLFRKFQFLLLSHVYSPRNQMNWDWWVLVFAILSLSCRRNMYFVESKDLLWQLPNVCKSCLSCIESRSKSSLNLNFSSMSIFGVSSIISGHHCITAEYRIIPDSRKGKNLWSWLPSKWHCF